MTRGKYANKSALRREDAEVRSDIETYQNAVKRLTAENQKLKDQLAEAQSSHAAEARRLRALLNEGLSPELLALREANKRLRSRWTNLKVQRDSELRDYVTAARRLENALITRFGMKRADASALADDIWLDGTTQVVRRSGRSHDAASIARAQQKRGIRDELPDLTVAAPKTKGDRAAAAAEVHALAGLMEPLFAFDGEWGSLSVTFCTDASDMFAFVIEADHNGLGLTGDDARRLAEAILNAGKSGAPQ